MAEPTQETLERAYEAKAMQVLGFVEDKGGRYGTYVANTSGKMVYRWVSQAEAKRQIAATKEEVRRQNRQFMLLYRHFYSSYQRKSLGNDYRNLTSAFQRVSSECIIDSNELYHSKMKQTLCKVKEANAQFADYYWDYSHETRGPILDRKRAYFAQMGTLEQELFSSQNKGHYETIRQFFENRGLLNEASTLDRITDGFVQLAGYVTDSVGKVSEGYIAREVKNLVSYVIKLYTEKKEQFGGELYSHFLATIKKLDAAVLNITSKVKHLKYRPVSMAMEFKSVFNEAVHRNDLPAIKNLEEGGLEDRLEVELTASQKALRFLTGRRTEAEIALSNPTPSEPYTTDFEDLEALLAVA